MTIPEQRWNIRKPEIYTDADWSINRGPPSGRVNPVECGTKMSENKVVFALVSLNGFSPDRGSHFCLAGGCISNVSKNSEPPSPCCTKVSWTEVQI
jgi:hypothetical protein